MHYECTRLPAYQLYLFTRKKFRLFICDLCIIGEIPIDIIEHSTEYTDRDESKEDIYLEKIKSLEEHLDVLRQHIKDQEKIRNLGEDTIKDYEVRLQERNEAMTQKQEEIDQLKDQEVQSKNKFKSLTEQKQNTIAKLNIELKDLKEKEKKQRSASNSDKKGNKDLTLLSTKLKDENDILKAELDLIKKDHSISLSENAAKDMGIVNEAINVKLKNFQLILLHLFRK